MPEESEYLDINQEDPPEAPEAAETEAAAASEASEAETAETAATATAPAPAVTQDQLVEALRAAVAAPDAAPPQREFNPTGDMLEIQQRIDEMTDEVVAKCPDLDRAEARKSIWSAARALASNPSVDAAVAIQEFHEGGNHLILADAQLGRMYREGKIGKPVVTREPADSVNPVVMTGLKNAQAQVQEMFKRAGLDINVTDEAVSRHARNL